MRTTRRSIRAAVVLALVASACSGGGTSSATKGGSAARRAATASVAPGYVVAGFGDCPNRDTTTSTSLAVLNRGVVGLGKRMVPIDALNVRVCEYDSHWIDGSHVVPGKLVESALLKPRAARQFEAETNRLPTDNPGPSSCTGAGGGALFVTLTFANDAQRVSLAWPDGACGPSAVSNGYDAAYPVSAWSIDLFRYATKRDAT